MITPKNQLSFEQKNSYCFWHRISGQKSRIEIRITIPIPLLVHYSQWICYFGKLSGRAPTLCASDFFSRLESQSLQIEFLHITARGHQNSLLSYGFLRTEPFVRFGGICATGSAMTRGVSASYVFFCSIEHDNHTIDYNFPWIDIFSYLLIFYSIYSICSTSLFAR